MSHTTEIRRKAADLIEQLGWHQGFPGHGSRGEVCMVVALSKVTDEHNAGLTFQAWASADQAIEDLRAELGVSSLVEWQDSPERTLDEVVSALRGPEGKA
jgi:hypothetical protein